MTLVLTINGPDSIWLLADRRLSHRVRPPKDDARKVMFLETTDGVAILGYAGLGATALGTEPADWMNAVLRGRNLPLEQSLGVLADAMGQQLPRHMRPTPGLDGHALLATAFVGKEVRLYTIEVALAANRKAWFRFRRHLPRNPAPLVPRIFLSGSGGAYLLRQRTKWLRPLLHVANAYDRGQVSANAVADRLAAMNYEVN